MISGEEILDLNAEIARGILPQHRDFVSPGCRDAVDGLIVEDIVDTGHTLHYLDGMLRSRNPASVRTAAFLHKEHKTEVDVEVDYIGFTIGDEWVVGYGLDFAEHDRTLPYIGIVHPDDQA